MRVNLDTSRGIRLLGLGKGVTSSGGRVFGVMVGDRRVYSDEVTVRETKKTATGTSIAFDLPDALGSGVLDLSSGKEPGVVNTSLALTIGRAADCKILFPLLENLKLDAVPQDKIEFFFPLQEGWIGRGEYDLSTTYGFRGWLPVLAAWNPKGTGIALQSRDATFTFRSLRFRNTSPGKTASAYHGCDALDMPGSFPSDSTGLSLSVQPIGIKLSKGQTWKSPTAAIQVYDGKQLFKTPFKSYEKWARATWWKHRKTPDWLRDSFMSFAVHERVGNAGFSRGLHDGKKFTCSEQAAAYNATTGGHAFVEWCHWWNHGELLTSGPYAGRRNPMTGEGEYLLDEAWGGLPAYREEVKRCHDAGARICLYFLGGSVWKTSPIGREHKQDWGVMRTPGKVDEVWSAQEDIGSATSGFWDICSEVPEWQKFLRDAAYRVLTETGVDAVRMDTKCEAIICHNPNHPHADDPLRGALSYMRTIREGVNKAGADKALMGEFAGSDAAAQYFDSALAQGHDIDTPLVSQMTPYGISPFRWVFPEMKCIEWGNVPKDYHQTTRRALFNGIGITVSDLNEDQLREMTRFAEAMRSVGDVLGSTDCEPLVPTLVGGVYANRFTLANRQVYTFWNQSKSEVNGRLIKIAGGAGRRFVNLLTGQELKTSRGRNENVVELSLPVNEVAIVGVFPKIIKSKATSEGTKYSAKPGVRLEVYDPQSCRVLSSGDGEVTVARGTAGRCVRAVSGGYLVQDCAAVKP